MAVYDISGTNLNDTAYDVSGEFLEQAYNIEGASLYDDVGRIKVMSYNVQWFSGINSNETMQEEIIDEYNVDIIGLQELTLGSSIPSLGSAIFDAYDYQYIGSQYNKTGIVSKTALSNKTSALFVNQASENRGYDKGYFTFNGKTICLINTHLETSSNESVKVAQAKEVFDLVENEEYFIITGDFNTVCKSVNDTEYNTIMKQFIDSGYHSANCSEQHGFINTWTDGSTASGTWYPCDQIITSGNIIITNVVVDDSKIAVAEQTGQSIDHLPIIAYLTI